MKRSLIKASLLIILWAAGAIAEMKFSVHTVNFFVGYCTCLIFNYK